MLQLLVAFGLAPVLQFRFDLLLGHAGVGGDLEGIFIGLGALCGVAL